MCVSFEYFWIALTVDIDANKNEENENSKNQQIRIFEKDYSNSVPAVERKRERTKKTSGNKCQYLNWLIERY